MIREKSKNFIINYFFLICFAAIVYAETDELSYELYIERFDDPTYKIGIDPITNENYSTLNGSYGNDWIPNLDEDDDTELPKSLEIFHVEKAKYILHIIGTEDTEYDVENEFINEVGNVVKVDVTGTISQGQIKKYLINYSPISGEPMEIYEYTPPGKPTNPTAEIGTQIKLTWEAPGNDGCLHWHTANTCHLSCLTG